MSLSLYDLNEDKASKSLATTIADGLMSKDDKIKLNGIAENANNYIHPSTHSATMITGLANVATTGNYTDLNNTPIIPTTLPANGGNADTVDNKHASDFALVSHTHSIVNLANDIAIQSSNEIKFGSTYTGGGSLYINYNDTGNITGYRFYNGGINLANIYAESFIGKFTGPLTGNADTATKLSTIRNISLTGDVSGSIDFDGSANVSITTTVADDSHNHVIANIDDLQTTLNAKAPLASPALTGIPSAPTAATGTNTTQIATTAFVNSQISNLVNSAPATLDTLNELATALGNDPNFATTMTNLIATKASTDVATTINNGLMSATDKVKLNGLSNYEHPATHPATIIVEDSTHRFVTDTEKSTWNNKADSSHTHNIIGFLDTRNVNFVPTAYQGISLHLKDNAIDGLSNGGGYHSVLNLMSWNDASGGKIHQIGLTDSGNMFLRSSNANGIDWDSWYKVWTEGNDGSGSGMDADLLDGKDSSQFFEKQSFGGVLTLNGVNLNNLINGGFYDVDPSAINTPATGMWWYVEVFRHSNPNVVYVLQRASRLDDSTNTIKTYTRTCYNNSWGQWYEMWNASNDGSGSGMNADLLDGKHAATTLLTTEKNDLAGAINELFTSASNGKVSIATAITGKGISASSSDSFSTLATKIGQIQTGIKAASGVVSVQDDATGNYIEVRGLDFTPSVVIVRQGRAYDTASAYQRVYWLDPNLGATYYPSFFDNATIRYYGSNGSYEVLKNQPYITVYSDGFKIYLAAGASATTILASWIATE